METQDKKSRKSKAFAILALMKNQSMSKVISDSFSAPVGSTRNAKAKSILKSVYKADNNYNYFINDGKGGLGPSSGTNPFQSMLDPLGQHSGAFVSQQSQAPYQSPTQQPEVVTGVDNLSSFKENIKSSIASSPAVSSLAGSHFAESIAPVDYSQPISRAEEARRAASGIPRRVGEQIEKGAEFAIKDILWPLIKHKFKGPILPTGIGASLFSEERPSVKWGEVYAAPTSETGTPITDPVSPMFKDPSKSYFKYADDGKVYEKSGKMEHIDWDEADKKNIWDQIETIERPTLGDGTAPFVTQTGQVSEEPVTITDKLAGDPDLGTSEGFANMTDEELEAFLNEARGDNSLNDYLTPSLSGASLKENIRAGYDLGLGADTTIAMLWQDKTKLAEMLGMSEEAAKLLPEYMLSSQLIDLRNTRYDEFRINEQRDKILDKQNRGLTIEDDLRGYVRGKDEYLGQVDKLLFDTRKSISEMDTSNPYVAERMGNYVNYLTILKGRQNQRYIDFLDMSVRDHRADIEQSTNMYNRDLETVNKLITDESALTSEAHGNIKSMLTEMYNNIESREDRQWTLESREMARAEEKRKVANNILNQQITQMKIDGYGVESDPVSPATFDKYKTFFGSEDENGNFVFDTYDPFEVLETSNVTQQNSGSVLTAFYQQMGRSVYGGASTGNISKSSLDNFKNAIRMNGGMNIDIDGQDVSVNDITAEQLASLTDEQKADYMVKQNNSQMRDKLEVNLRKGIADYLSSSEDKIRELRSAIEDLSRMERGLGTNWSRDKYVSKNEGLGEISGHLYDYVEKTMNLSKEMGGEEISWTSAEEVYSQLSSEDLPYYISNDLSEYLMY